MKPELLGATRADLSQLLQSLFFIPFRKLNGMVEPVLFVGWSLNYEMFFYVLFTLALTVRSYAAGLFGLVAGLAVLTAAGALAHPKNLYLSFYTSPVLIEFAIGMVLAFLLPRAPSSASLKVKLMVSLALLAAPVLVLEYLIWPNFPGIPVSAALSGALVAAGVLLDRWGWSVSFGPALLIGDASYVLYLSHPYVTQTVQKLNLPIPAVIQLLLAFGLATALAVFLHLFVEKPLTRVAKDLLGGRRGPVGPATAPVGL